MNKEYLSELDKSIYTVNNIAKYFVERSINNSINDYFPDIVSETLKLSHKLRLFHHILADNTEDNIDIKESNDTDDWDNHILYYASHPWEIDPDGYIIADGDEFVGFRD